MWFQATVEPIAGESSRAINYTLHTQNALLRALHSGQLNSWTQIVIKPNKEDSADLAEQGTTLSNTKQFVISQRAE